MTREETITKTYRARRRARADRYREATSKRVDWATTTGQTVATYRVFERVAEEETT